MGNWSLTDKFSFHAEWFDSESSMIRKFILSWFPSDDTMDLYDIKNKRMFLKRIRVKELSLSDIFVGNTITVFSRQFKLVDFANVFTKNYMGETMQEAFAIIKPESIEHNGRILQILIKNGFKVTNIKMLKVPEDQIKEIFPAAEGDTELNFLVASFTSGPIIALELIGKNGTENLLKLVGPEDPEEARKVDPTSLRAMYGKDTINNGIFVAKDAQAVTNARSVLFRKPPVDKISTVSTALLQDSTCCIVKPHAIREGHLGDIIVDIEENGFKISALEMFYLDVHNAGEFLEVYNGVLPEYPDMVKELLSGGCVVMEITGPSKEETPVEFRKIVGPSDPDIAKQLRPDTLRAKYGVDKIRNALHVTDLPEDAPLEVEYFFRILQL